MIIKIFIIILFSNIVFANASVDDLIPNESNQIVNPKNIPDIQNDQSQKNIDQSNGIHDLKSNNNIKEEVSHIPTNSSTIINNNVTTQPNTDSHLVENKKIDDHTQNGHVENNAQQPNLDNDKESPNYKLSNINYYIMFNDTEINLINDALSNFLSSQNSQDSSNNPNLKTKTQNIIEDIIYEKPKNIPSFYLGSIIFKGPEEWSIWINSKHIKSSLTGSIKIDEDNNISVILVNKNYVIFRWQTGFLDDFNANWRNILHEDKDIGGYSSYNNSLIIDKDSHTVTFKLKVNETFDVKNMNIEEGYKPSSQLVIEKPLLINKSQIK